MSKRKERTGIVVSDKMDKTRVVKVMRLVKHPVYNKIIKKFSKLKVDDPENKSKIGEKVKIRETRPLSKDKRWRIVEISK
ncbi:MAG: 30S ribosomal protein S17 [Candidatus Omnitrophica bacterium 4484_213]|nr:MAG: 30S ribosomal protein S17 [Candidatus Omnitrophica bacterium 4484_213]